MGWDSERESEKIFLSFNKILRNFKILGIRTRNGKEITHKDLRQAVNIMEKKHLNCRWKYTKRRKNYTVLLREGYFWLMNVYFQNKKRQIDADIDFFTHLIKQYEEVIKVEPKTLWDKDLYVDELEEYFDRSAGTIKNNIIKMNKVTKGIYRYKKDGKYIISKLGIEWLCKNCFKQKYLELLEIYVDLKNRQLIYDAYSENTKEIKEITKGIRHLCKFLTQINDGDIRDLKAKMFRIIRLQQEMLKLIGKKLDLEVWQKINRNKSCNFGTYNGRK